MILDSFIYKMEHLNKRVKQKETRNPLIQLDTNILNAIILIQHHS